MHRHTLAVAGVAVSYTHLDVYKRQAVLFEDTSRGKFTKLVAYHVFRDVHGGKVLASVHQESQADEVRRNRCV